MEGSRGLGTRLKRQDEGSWIDLKNLKNLKNSSIKRYKTATDGLTYLTLGIGVQFTAENDWRGVGRPQVATHIAFATFSIVRFYANQCFAAFFLSYKVQLT